MNYYRFTSKVDAQKFLDSINNNQVFPITGRNAKTGKLAPDKQKTERWTDKVDEHLDLKFGFAVPTDIMFQKLEIDETEKTALVTDNKASIEEYDKTWFPEDLEIVKAGAVK